MSTIKIILVDDHEIVRDGIRALLLGQPQIKIIGDACDSEELFEYLENQTPDIVILDIRMPGHSGIEIAGMLKKDFPDIKPLMLSAETDEQSIHQAIENGAKGFLPKDCSKSELIEAINTIAKGRNYFGQNILSTVFKGFVDGVQNPQKTNTALDALSERELEVIKHLSDGMSYKEIAKELFISPRTVESHKKSIFEKLELSNNAQLIKFAIKHKIVEL
ncbi:MAG: response regulator transcription factor [Aureispira sp.]|nr:response regulator transcription factor [Aureispira sp.]